MTKYEMIEQKLNSLSIQLKKAEQDGTGLIQYAEKNYFARKCDTLKYHTDAKEHNFGTTWDDLTRLAKRLFRKQNISQLTYEEADICVGFINECVAIVNKYEDIVNEYTKKQEEQSND